MPYVTAVCYGNKAFYFTFTYVSEFYLDKIQALIKAGIKTYFHRTRESVMVNLFVHDESSAASSRNKYQEYHVIHEDIIRNMLAKYYELQFRLLLSDLTLVWKSTTTLSTKRRAYFICEKISKLDHITLINYPEIEAIVSVYNRYKTQIDDLTEKQVEDFYFEEPTSPLLQVTYDSDFTCPYEWALVGSTDPNIWTPINSV